MRDPRANQRGPIRNRLRRKDRDPQAPLDVIDAARVDHADDARHQREEQQQLLADRHERAGFLADAATLRGAHELAFLFPYAEIDAARDCVG